MMPDGQPQSSLVWVDYDGTHVLINTALGRSEMQEHASQSQGDSARGRPEQDRPLGRGARPGRRDNHRGAIPHADKLAQRYMGKQHFYGDVYRWNGGTMKRG